MDHTGTRTTLSTIQKRHSVNLDGMGNQVDAISSSSKPALSLSKVKGLSKNNLPISTCSFEPMLR